MTLNFLNNLKTHFYNIKRDGMNSIKAIGYLFFLSLLFLNDSYALLNTGFVYRNRRNGRLVILLGDTHTLGSEQENIDQMEDFVKNVVNFCETTKIQIDLLNENKYSYP